MGSEVLADINNEEKKNCLAPVDGCMLYVINPNFSGWKDKRQGGRERGGGGDSYRRDLPLFF